MVLNRWNYEKHDYEPYEVPDDWNVKMYSNDMGEIINCCQCGRRITFGEGYTSKEVHNNFGFGYIVCEKCNDEEWVRYMKKPE